MKAFFGSPAIWLYVATVVLVNIGFSYVPMLATPLGMVSPMALIVGAVFVIRDFAQRQAGHSVLAAMVVAVILSYVLADPYVATASALAFGAAELMDYLIYTATKRPFHQRILLSSLVSTPVDTGVFLLGISGFTIGTFSLMVLSKMVAAVAIFYLWREPSTDSRQTSFVIPN